MATLGLDSLGDTVRASLGLGGYTLCSTAGTVRVIGLISFQIFYTQ